MPTLILASGSSARRAMLETAGVVFSVVPANVDEAAIRNRLISARPPYSLKEIAKELAIAKADEVSAHHPGAYVIGSDQILALDGAIFEKPRTIADARASLEALRGKTHELHSSVAIVHNNRNLWRHTETARLKMRNFLDAEIDRYLAREGESVCTSVGAYKIEGPAITLFERVRGDHWTILGMPLLPLLSALRAKELLP